MGVVDRGGLVRIAVGSLEFAEPAHRVAERLREIADYIRLSPFPELFCEPQKRLPRLRFQLRENLFIHYAGDSLRNVYVIYGSPGSRRGIQVPAISPDHYMAIIDSEPGDPRKGRGSLRFLDNEVGFYLTHGKSYLREDDFYGRRTPPLLEISLPPAWEQEDFDFTGVINEHVKRHEDCLQKIFEGRKAE